MGLREAVGGSWLWATLALLGVGVMVGCGSEGGDEAGSATSTVTVQQGKPPSKAEFIREADSICSDGRDETEALEDQFSDQVQDAASQDDLREAADTLREVVAIVEAKAQRLRALQPPEGDEDVIDNWLTTGQTVLTIDKQYADAIEAGDQEQITALEKQITELTPKTDGIAQGYGFKVCGKDG